MKDKEIGIIMFLITLSFMMLMVNWISTDYGFFVEDPTTGIMRYNYESYDWDPDPAMWLGSLLSIVIINFTVMFYVISNLFKRKPCKPR